MDIRIEWIYRTPKRAETVFRSDEMPASQKMLFVEDLQQSGCAINVKFIDRFDCTWTMSDISDCHTRI